MEDSPGGGVEGVVNISTVSHLAPVQPARHEHVAILKALR